MPNSKSWTKERQAQRYLAHKEEIKIRRRRERMAKGRKKRESKKTK